VLDPISVQPNEQEVINQLAVLVRELAPRPVSWVTYIPAISAAIAALSAFASIVFFFMSQKNTRDLASEARTWRLRPVIVFYRRGERVWIVKNIGEGTAVEVRVRNYVGDDQIRDEVTLYPVAPGEAIRLDYLKGPATKLVATYLNVFGQDPHHTVCSNDKNDIRAGVPTLSQSTPFGSGHESRIEEWTVTRL
jgi:hypothetical protein